MLYGTIRLFNKKNDFTIIVLYIGIMLFIISYVTNMFLAIIDLMIR
jgi:hypothetical protein